MVRHAVPTESTCIGAANAAPAAPLSTPMYFSVLNKQTQSRHIFLMEHDTGQLFTHDSLTTSAHNK